jgi:hypothetical protein
LQKIWQGLVQEGSYKLLFLIILPILWSEYHQFVKKYNVYTCNKSQGKQKVIKKINIHPFDAFIFQKYCELRAWNTESICALLFNTHSIDFKYYENFH